MHCLLPLLGGFVCVLVEHMLELSDSASDSLKAVIMRQRVPVGRDVRKLEPQREPGAGFDAVLLCVLPIRLEHALVHGDLPGALAMNPLGVLMLPLMALMVASPALRPVTRPSPSTVATVGLLLIQTMK